MAGASWDDPLGMWREMLDKFERQFNEAGNKVMGQEQFSAAVNKASVLPLAMQKAMGEAMAKYFAALNLPSRDDILSLGERMSAVEEQLRRLADAVAPAPAAAASPPRTRKPKPPPPKETAS
ncbi:MAG: hypothetical protein QM698_08205 [Micropepsaceae bacterium]